MKRRMAILAVVACVFSMGAAAAEEPEVYSGWPFDEAEAKRRQEETAEVLGMPVKWTVELKKGTKTDLILIPAGEFMMGSPESEPERQQDEGPLHRVRITSPFYMAPIECTGGLWRRITGKTLEGNAGRPATNVTWEEIQERVFAELNKKAPDGMVCRLPTEAEWEYACRAGTATPFHYGSTINSDRVNFNANYGLRRENQEGPRYSSAVRGKYRERPIRPGSFPPNAWGLHDMHGNVWEWCLDLYDPDFYKQSPADDPLNAEDEETSQRVLRGGCFNDVPADCRSANRSKQPQDVRDRRFGFRIVLAFE